MTIVAGVDFGTLSVRVSIIDSDRGRLGTAVAQYPLHRKREDPDFATQSHADHMRALAEATRAAVQAAGIKGDQIAAIALDTTGSSVVPVDALASTNNIQLFAVGPLVQESTAIVHHRCQHCTSC